LHLLDPMIVDGDLRVAPNAKLIVYPTAEMRFEAGDRLATGRDPFASELHIDGQLAFARGPLMQQFSRWSWQRIQNIPPQPVHFRALQAGATWYGIISSPNAQLDIPDNSLVLEDVAERASVASQLFEPIATGISQDQTATPAAFQIAPNYPNPFNSQTTIPFALPKPTKIRLVIYNALGQIVRVLVDQERPAGRYEEVWDLTTRHQQSGSEF
jgi:hypothetical protein